MEEWGSSSEESDDENEQRERLTEGMLMNVDADGTTEEEGDSDDSEDDEEEEEESPNKSGKEEEEEQMSQSQRTQTMAKTNRVLSYVENSDSESSSSQQDSPKTIGKILASDRGASTDNGVLKATAFLQKSSGVIAPPPDHSSVKKAKPEAIKRPREDTEDEKIVSLNRKKDVGVKILPSSDGSCSLKLKNRMDSSDKDEIAAKKLQKQNLQMQDSSQPLAEISSRNGELEVKGKRPQQIDTAEKMECRESETNKKNRKRKKPVQTTPPKQTCDSFSPQRQKKPAVWTSNDEILVALGAMQRIKAGLDFPPKKGDDYWIKLSEELQGKWTRDQIYEKFRRMRSRYRTIADRTKLDDSIEFKNVHEENLFKIWRQTWGKGGKEEKEEGDKLKNSKGEANDMNKYEGQEQKVKGTAKSRGKLEVAGLQKKEVNDELGTSRGGHNEPLTQDTEKRGVEAQGGGAVQMDTDLRCTSAYGVVSPAFTAGTSLLNNGEGMLLQRCSINATLNEVLKPIQDAHKAFIEDLQTSCNRVLQELETKVILTVQSALKTAGNNSTSRNALSIPSLAVGDYLNMTLPCMNGLGDNKLRQQWHEQHIQELKVFSQRLRLMQEECRIQQEHFETQLNSNKL